MRDESSASHAHGAEEWCAIPGQEGRYEVSNLGRVRSLRRRGKSHGVGYDRPRPEPLVMRLDTTPDGYRTVHLAGSPRRRVHRLVLEAFVGPCPAGHEGSHLNGDRADNRLANLRWLIHVENETHKVLHGTLPTGDRNGARLHVDRRPRGDRNGSRKFPERVSAGVRRRAQSRPESFVRGEAFWSAKLTADLVREIRRRYAAGEGSHKKLAAEYGIAQSSLRQVVTRRSWRHVE